MKKPYHYLTFVLLFFLLFNACRNKEKKQQAATTSEETVLTHIAADETFAPIVEDELFIFEAVLPKTNVEAIYKPERGVLNLLLNDSVQIAVLSRELNSQEAKVFTQRNIKIRTTRFAIDGIALIINKSAADSTITVDEITSIMKGKSVKPGPLVFDNANSSTVRYLMELADIKLLPKKGVYALKANNDVIKYVHNNPGAIGVIGINWIEQPDADVEKDVADLRVMAVKGAPGKPGSDKFYKPNQNNLALGVYPLTRNLYIVDCSGGARIGNTLASFFAGEQGQRIVLKSGLLPDSIPPRQIIINKDKLKYK